MFGLDKALRYTDILADVHSAEETADLLRRRVGEFPVQLEDCDHDTIMGMHPCGGRTHAGAGRPASYDCAIPSNCISVYFPELGSIVGSDRIDERKIDCLARGDGKMLAEGAE